MAISSNQPMREAEIDLLEAFNDADLSALPGLVETIGDSTSGLVKDVSDLETTVGNSASGLVKDVSDLETTVGDSTSGLVKDVSDLETTVGNSSSGLVKDVSDLKSEVTNVSETTPSNIATGASGITITTARYEEKAKVVTLQIRFRVTESKSNGFKVFDLVGDKKPLMLVYGSSNATWANYFSLNAEGACYTLGTPTVNTEYIVTFTYVK